MKKIFNLFMALMVGATMVSLSSCSKDDKDSGIDPEEWAKPLAYSVSSSDNTVTLTGTNKAVKYVEEYVFQGESLSAINIREEVDCGTAANAAIVVAALQGSFPEDEGYHVTVSQSGSKVVVSGTRDIDDDEAGMTKEQLVAFLNDVAEMMN